MKHFYSQKKKIQPQLPNSFNSFSYSKKSKLDFFGKNDLDMKFFGKKLNPDKYSIHEYQTLLLYHFVLKNLSKGSRILKIGSGNPEISAHFSKEYECWELKNTMDLIADPFKSRSISVTNYKNEEIPLSNIYNYFDLVYSISAFDDLKEERKNFYNIEFNLNRILKPGANSIHNFLISIKNNHLKYNKFLDYLIVNSHSKVSMNQCLTGYLKTKEILADPDLLFENQKPESKIRFLQSKEDKEIVRNFSYSIILKKGAVRIPSSTDTKQSQYLEKNPAYLFHHIPKCGGKSTANALRNWFDVEPDHYLKENINYNDYIKFKYNVDRITSDFCLMGHYSHEGFFVHQRYPEFVQKNDKYRLITFLRDPFKQRISRYYYFKQKGIINDKLKLEPMLQVTNNIIATHIPCTEHNYKEMMDRYFFVGITEYLQESLDKLADLLGKKKVVVPKINTSSKDSQLENLSPDFMEKFKEDNKLDYMIYEYCLEKFLKS